MTSFSSTSFPRRSAGAILLFALSSPAWSGGEQSLQRVVVTGSSVSEVGTADAASVGTVTRAQLEARTVYRAGELLEATPGLVVSQHSGEGKSNQFYLRGFNLDHGTDLRTTVDGMLVNQRSHAHGQGWTDLNFLIPELAVALRYKKGPYDASEGDFASAGAVEVIYADRLTQGIAQLGAGQNGFRRMLLADSPRAGDGTLLYALELMRNDGPFTHPDDYQRTNAVLRWSHGNAAHGWQLGAMHYDADWNATDQIPARAVADGRLGRFDAIDNSDGGAARRSSLSGRWWASGDEQRTELRAAIVATRLDLFSNFTYFLDDPVDGDQFAQPDRRTTVLAEARHERAGRWFNLDTEHQFGAQFQHDRIRNALLKTAQRQALATVRSDRIRETSLGLWAQSVTRWTPWMRSILGLRVDHYRFSVDSDLAVNSGRANDTLLSPKLNLAFGPWRGAEAYVNAGRGFHSNDARGTVIAVDPASGDAVDPVTPLARSSGVEIGLRVQLLPGLQSSLAVYRLDLDSELLFVGDAGTTEATRPSRRVGFEWANYWKPNRWLTVDADLAFAEARFRDAAPEGRRIPGAVEGVATLAAAVDSGGPWFGALQMRWFGPRSLVEDNSVRSRATATLNGRLGYRFSAGWSVDLEVFNLTNREDAAIDYYYTSRLPGEPADGVDDVHFHPIESRSLRLTLSGQF